MLSDSERVKEENRQSVVRRPIDAPTNKHWSDSQKIEAVTTYIILGSLSLTAAALKIPLETLKNWKVSNWWKDVHAEIREQENLVLSHRLKNIVEKTLLVVEDRLEDGDFIYDQKAQKLVRKPVSLKDAHKVGMDMVVIQQKLISPEERQMQEEGVKEKLEKLAKSFEDFAQKQLEKPKVVVTDVIFAEEQPHAVHEERKEGL